MTVEREGHHLGRSIGNTPRFIGDPGHARTRNLEGIVERLAGLGGREGLRGQPCRWQCHPGCVCGHGLMCARKRGSL